MNYLLAHGQGKTKEGDQEDPTHPKQREFRQIDKAKLFGYNKETEDEKMG